MRLNMHIKLYRMRGILLGLVFVLCNAFVAVGADLKTVKLPFTSFTMEQLPYQLAEKKGFFKEEGLALIRQ